MGNGPGLGYLCARVQDLERECLPILVHVGGVVHLEEARHVPHTSDLVSRWYVASISRCNCESGSSSSSSSSSSSTTTTTTTTVGREIEIERVVDLRVKRQDRSTLSMSRVRVGVRLLPSFKCIHVENRNIHGSPCSQLLVAQSDTTQVPAQLILSALLVAIGFEIVRTTSLHR